MCYSCEKSEDFSGVEDLPEIEGLGEKWLLSLLNRFSLLS